VRRLHRRHDAQAQEALEVGGRDDLTVLDAEAGRRALTREARRLVGVENRAIGGVADRVHAQLHARIGAPLRQLPQSRRHRQPAVAGPVRVRFQQRRAARSQRPVGVALDRAHLQQAVLRPPRPLLDRFGLVLRQHEVGAQLPAAGRVQQAHVVDELAADPRVVHAAQPVPEALPLRRQHAPLHVLDGRVGDRRRHEPHGAVDEHPGRIAVLVEQDLAARGRLDSLQHAGLVQRREVRQRRVAVDAHEPHGMIRRRRRQFRVVRHRLIAPVVLVPAASPDPLALLRLCSGSGDALHDLVEAARPHEVDLLERLTQAQQVRVRILQARHHERRTQVAALGPLGCRRALGRDAPADDDEVAVPRLARAGPHGGVLQHEILGQEQQGEQGDHGTTSLGITVESRNGSRRRA
jgi:hypothetical protein